jgi:hypothetical protein
MCKVTPHALCVQTVWNLMYLNTESDLYQARRHLLTMDCLTVPQLGSSQTRHHRSLVESLGPACLSPVRWPGSLAPAPLDLVQHSSQLLGEHIAQLVDGQVVVVPAKGLLYLHADVLKAQQLVAHHGAQGDGP